MKIWIAKAFIQKSISFLPFKHKVNYLFQRYVTKGVNLTDALMDDKLTHCKNHLAQAAKFGLAPENISTLEIGTGWYPIVPIGFYLAGAEEIYTIDISDLMKADAVKATIRKFIEYQNSGKLNAYLPQINLQRLATLEKLVNADFPVAGILAKMNVTSIVGDARKTDWPAAKFDLINSNNTFEHIYPEILIDILKEFKRLLKPEGLMSHQIDMSDHFAHLDKSITIYNFLQFSDAEWSRIDNSIQPQNRLRIIDYHKLFEQAGFKILEEVNRPGSIEDLRRVKLAEKFKPYSESELAVSHALLIAR